MFDSTATHHKEEPLRTSAPSAPLPDPQTFTVCDDCGRPFARVCVECGEWSHDFVRGTKRGEWIAIPLNHDDCQEQLGWRDERGECEHCACPGHSEDGHEE